MFVAVIVDESCPPIHIIVERLRAASFYQTIHLFVQPDIALGHTDIENVYIRQLSTPHTYEQLWRNILHWHSVQQHNEPISIFDGKCIYTANVNGAIEQALAVNMNWGLLSAYVPVDASDYFTDTPHGWCQRYVPTGLQACCLSTNAARLILQAPGVWSTEFNAEQAPHIVFDILAAQGMVQASHFPSLSSIAESLP